MKLTLLRHGQSEGNVSQEAGLDPPLTRLGEEQIKLAAQRLKGELLDGIYCSPLYRGMQTAAILRDGLGKSAEVDPVFCEVWGDDWHARSLEELKAAFSWAAFPESMRRERWWPLRAETAGETQERAQKALQRLWDAHGKNFDHIVLITHGTFENVLIQRLCGMPFSESVFFENRNGSLTRIEIENTFRRIVYVNEVAHLPPEFWT